MKKTFYAFCVFIAITIMAMFTCCRSNNEHEDNQQGRLQKGDTVEIYKETPVEACTMMLQIKNEMIKSKHVDSVYIHMPTDAIICIVLKYPDYTIEDVVNEYEKNIKYYNEILKTKKEIEQYKEIIKESMPLPDSIPNKPKVDITNNKIDSAKLM